MGGKAKISKACEKGLRRWMIGGPPLPFLSNTSVCGVLPDGTVAMDQRCSHGKHEARLELEDLQKSADNHDGSDIHRLLLYGGGSTEFWP